MRSQHSSKPFKHQRTVISEKLKDASSAVSGTKNSQQAEAQPDSLKEKRDREKRDREKRRSSSKALWNFIYIQQQQGNYEYNWAGKRAAFRAGLTSYNSDLICRRVRRRVRKAVGAGGRRGSKIAFFLITFLFYNCTSNFVTRNLIFFTRQINSCKISLACHFEQVQLEGIYLPESN